jgi:hypothetical protein
MEGPLLCDQGKAAALALVSCMKSQLRSLKLHETELSNRIGLLYTTISGLASLAKLAAPPIEDTPVRQQLSRWPDLTENCASLLSCSPRPLTIGEICSELAQHAALGERRTRDPLLAVWQTLQQLASSGVVRVDETDGTRRWSWTKSDRSEVMLPAVLELISDHGDLTRQQPGQTL